MSDKSILPKEEGRGLDASDSPLQMLQIFEEKILNT